ncbi:MAG: preprotein translocase subunit SecG [Alphaproteobacteria bacterium]|nr:preprotein translocase subunit SecG [Alphaproteobacteria bacterium]MBF0250907.1 preprotein translocase subunit SecG [Alphaproteobacteria bacterium]
MLTVLLVIHVLVTIGLIGIVLIQKSEGGALGIGGGGGGMGGFMTGRSTANLLTRTTAILAALFMGLSLAIAVISTQGREKTSILDSAETPAVTAPAPVQEEAPKEPETPAAPVAE